MSFEVIIGLEVHAQLDTKTKMFCRCDNDAFGAKPNTRVCPVCMGFPGMLPVLNTTALQKGAAAAAALGCKVQEFSKFDRKNYFYPDLPNGFQISQFDQPISLDGRVEVYLDEKFQSFGITRVHLENDAGKLSHNAQGTFCDYNRAGTPLVEIVTEPDMRSPEQAQALAKEIQKILRACGASTADMEKGMMRFDASISMRPMGEDKLYPRTEIKNLNSFSTLLRALQYEVKKQTKDWKAGTPPTSEFTVGWNDEAGKTVIMRDKESATDYRYFPEPDIPPVVFTPEKIKAIEDAVPTLPITKLKKYLEIGLQPFDAIKLSEETELSDFFEAAGGHKKAANIILSIILSDPEWKDSKITPQHVIDVLSLTKSGQISTTGAKDIIVHAMRTGNDAESIMKELGLEQKSDAGEIEAWVKDVIDANPTVIEDIKNGKEKGIQFLVGQVMKASKGAANPGMVVQMIKKMI